MNKFLILILVLAVNLSAQHESIHKIQSDYYARNPHLIETGTLSKEKSDFGYGVESISHKVYGFHPYWISDGTAANYYYSMLTHVAYFSAEVDTGVATTGGFLTRRNWRTTQVVNYCKQNDVKIHLVITMFANHSRVLANTTYRTNLCNNILAEVQYRSADGANIDFESVSSAQKDNFRAFILELGTLLKANNLQLVVELPAVDWSSVYNNTFFTTVNNVVDYYFLMAYDYYWRGSSTAGPISPITTGTSIYHVNRSIDSYLSAGATASRLIAGFNYYGYEWPVTSSSRMANTTANGVSKTYNQAKTALASIPAEDKFFDDTYKSPWYRYQSGSQWYQTWYDDSLSMSYKYDAVKTKGIIGTGMWALSYDGSNSELWGALKKAFATEPNSENTMLGDFEYSAGTFNNIPTYSGSTVGVSALSTAARSVEQAMNGYASLKIVLKDSASFSSNWSVRLVSGGGTPANNLTLNATGSIGFWMKSTSVPTGAQVAILLDDGAGGTELSSKVNVINNGDWNLYEWSLPGTGWTNFSGGNGAINGPTVTLDALMFYAPNASADWTIYIEDVSYSASALPVEMVSFSAKVISGKVNLNWSTATEVNNYGFEVERSLSSHLLSLSGHSSSDTWEVVGFVAGSGNSNSVKEYSFTDNLNHSSIQPFNHTISYRLKQIDNDGTFAYSKTVEADNLKPSAFDLRQNYPNPFNPSTMISYQLPVTAQVTLKVFDVLGNEVVSLVNQQQEAGSYNVTLDASTLASGTYIYRLIAGDFVSTKKLVVLK
ncbi:MAG TPA: glycosyl hydrolase family 18 protein [Ignavibacteriaceae bacterium]|nr:glycosyl hydrolase family 18 protein [Ignavibacteriaceae bacterium]